MFQCIINLYPLAAAFLIYLCQNAVPFASKTFRAQFFGGGVRARRKRIFVENKRVWKRVHRLAVLTAVVGIVFIGLGALLQFILNDIAAGSAVEELQFRVEEYGDAIRGVLRGNVQTLDSLACFVGPWEGMEAEDIAAGLSRAIARTDYEGMAWFPVEGESVIVSREGSCFIGLPAEGLAQDARASIAGAQAGVSQVSGIYDGSMVLPEGERGLLYAAPVGLNGGTIGALAAVDDAHVLTRVVYNFNQDDAGGYLHIIDAQGNLLVRPEDSLFDWPAGNIFDVPFLSSEERDSIRAALKQGESISLSFTYAGGNYSAVFVPVGIHDWYEICVCDADALSGSPMRVVVRALQLSAGVALALIVFLLGYYYSVLRRDRRDAANLAYIDPVTGADNFAGFTCRLGARQKGDRDYCLAALNISQFKFINGIFGRQQADQLLCFVKGVLDANMREGEFFCRDSGDIFYICLNGTGREAIRARIGEIMRTISRTSMGSASSYQVRTYCGVALAAEATEDSNIVTQVLFALESARSGHRNGICFYDSALRRDEGLDYYIESHMQQALDRGEFKLYFQPKVDLATDRVASAEVLVRWQTAEGNMILPSKFIPIFEKDGFCEELDLYVFEATCRQARQWMDAGVPPLAFSVNQTRPLFYRKGYVDTLCAIAGKYGVAPHLITLEVLEGLAMENADVLNAVIDALHQKGFQVSMDDFGSGYSSLNTLANLHIDELKLDKGFLKTLSVCEDGRLRVVLEETLSMARRLGIRTVVEGVETGAGNGIVHALGADRGQGYFYGHPMDAQAFCARFLKQN